MYYVSLFGYYFYFIINEYAITSSLDFSSSRPALLLVKTNSNGTLTVQHGLLVYSISSVRSVVYWEKNAP